MNILVAVELQSLSTMLLQLGRTLSSISFKLGSLVAFQLNLANC